MFLSCFFLCVCLLFREQDPHFFYPVFLCLGDLQRHTVRECHLIPQFWQPANGINHQTANGIKVLAVQVQAQFIIDVMKTELSFHHPGAVSDLPDIFRFMCIIFVMDLAHNFLDDVFHRDDA